MRYPPTQINKKDLHEAKINYYHVLKKMLGTKIKKQNCKNNSNKKIRYQKAFIFYTWNTYNFLYLYANMYLLLKSNFSLLLL